VLAAKQPIDRALKEAPLNSQQANFLAVLEVLAKLMTAKHGVLTKADLEELANIQILTSREMTTNGRVKTLVKRIGLSPALKRRRSRNHFKAGFAGDTPTPTMKALVSLGMLERTLLTPERIMRELRVRLGPRMATAVEPIRRKGGRKRTQRDDVLLYLQRQYPAGVPGAMKSSSLLEDLKSAGIEVGEKTLRRAMQEHHSAIAN
jgi:hypothetical protein